MIEVEIKAGSGPVGTNCAVCGRRVVYEEDLNWLRGTNGLPPYEMKPANPLCAELPLTDQPPPSSPSQSSH